MGQEKKLDLIVFGATGFTGRLCCEHIARTHGDTLAWGIAGRNKDKLESVVAEIAGNMKGAKPVVIIADSTDEKAIDLMCQQARVVLSTAGPFAKYGSHVVASCAKHGTHYCDITGEAIWVKEMGEKYDKLAKQSKAIIVSFCGYDSVPSDLGALFAVLHLKDKLGKKCGKVKCLIGPTRGSASGGTLQTALHVLSNAPSYPKQLFRSATDPYYLLDAAQRPQPAREVLPVSMLPSFDLRSSSFTCFCPLSPANSQVVRKSAAALGYGPDFTYDEVASFGGGSFFSTVVGFFIVIFMSLGISLAPLFVVPPFRWLVPEAGTGPSEAVRKAGFFRHRVWAEEAGSGSDRTTVLATVKGDMDPGYGSTSKMAVEAALALAMETKRLPAAASAGGLLSPATAMGMVLVERLQRFAGVKFEIVSESVAGKKLK